MTEDYIWFGNNAFTQEEIDALEKAIEHTKMLTVSQGVYALLEEQARRDRTYPDFPQYKIDIYLEAKGYKPVDIIIPPRVLAGSYRLLERFIKRGAFLPEWHTRPDGAILYTRRWWSTTSPAGGWMDYAWFQVESALIYTRVSEWMFHY